MGELVEHLIKRLTEERDCLRDNLKSAQDSASRWCVKAQDRSVVVTRLTEQVATLLSALEKGSVNRARDVRNFFVAANKEDELRKVPEHPSSAKNKVVRRCVKLVVEETFELMEAVFDLNPAAPYADPYWRAKDLIKHVVEGAIMEVDMVETADALGDIDYVVEGVRQVLGIDGDPIWRLIHAANMDKFRDGPKYRDDGKVIKPEGWKEPDIDGELRRQGWPR